MKISIKAIILSLLFLAINMHAQDNCPVKKATLLPSNDIQRQSIINSIFPMIEAKSLSKNKISLPNKSASKPTILCMLFKDEGRPLASNWTKNILSKYTKQEVNLQEIALLPAGLKLLRGTIEKGMRKDVDLSFHDSYLTYFGKTKFYKEQLMMLDNNSCYVFLLDANGKIIYTADGDFNNTKMEAIHAKITPPKAELKSIPNVEIKNEVAIPDTITYVFDPLCGFCYAFEPEMKKLEATYNSKFVFEVIPGGMIVGAGEGPISKVAPHIAYGYKDLEKMSSSKFGDKFLKDIMKVGTYKMSSEMPSIAVTVFKSILPNKAIAFASDVQSMLYYDGISLNEPENYKALATKYGLNADDFVAKLKMTEWKTNTQKQFSQAENLGVTSYPALVLKRNGKVQIVSSGFEKYSDLIKQFPFNN
jgi:putative protein-disulfide isomerase